jgi:hypothetical protein
MTDSADIEIRIDVKKYRNGEFREKKYVYADSNYGIGLCNHYEWNGVLFYMYKYYMGLYPQRFHKNGTLYEMQFKIGKKEHSYYTHEWWENGATSRSEWCINRANKYPRINYYKNGNLQNKVYYKADGEKDYILCYWDGPPLPTTEDGAIHRSAIPIVLPLESELRTEKKGRPFDLSALENAVLREEDITTL